MNSDSPHSSREELEARLTALLLGELSTDEAALLRQGIAQDAELARLHHRLKLAMELMRETATWPEQEELTRPDPLKLAPERRARLLESLKVARKIDFPSHQRAKRREWLALAAMLVGLLAVAGIIMPNLGHSPVALTAFWDRRLGAASTKGRPQVVTQSATKSEEFSEGQGIAAPPVANYFSEESLKDVRRARELRRESPSVALKPEANLPTSTPNRPLANQPAGPVPIATPPPAKPGQPLGELADRSEETLVSRENILAGQSLAFDAGRVPADGAQIHGTESGRAIIQSNSDRIVLPQLGEASSRDGDANARQSSAKDFFSDSGLQSGNGFVPSAPGSQFGDGGGRGGFQGIGDGSLSQNQAGQGDYGLAGERAVASQADRFYQVGRSVLAEPNLVAPNAPQVGNLYRYSSERESLGLFGQNDKEADQKKNIQQLEDTRTSELTLQRRMSGGVGDPLARPVGQTAQAIDPANGLPVSGGNVSAGEALAQNGRGNVKAITESGTIEANTALSLGNTPTLGSLFQDSLASIVNGASTTRKEAPGLPRDQKQDFDADGTAHFLRMDPSGVAVNDGKAKKPEERKLAELAQTELRTITGGVKLVEDAVENLAKRLKTDSEQLAEGAKHKDAKLAAPTSERSRQRVEIALPETSGLDQREKQVAAAPAVISEIQAQPQDTPVERLARLSEEARQRVATVEGKSIDDLVMEKGKRSRGEKVAAAEGKSIDELERRKKELNPEQADVSLPKLAATAGIPQPEIQAADNPFSTFSLNVSDVSFKLAAASIEKGVMPEPATVRSEEFINAFDYRDLEPSGSAPIAFAWERARYPFAHDRDLLRFSVKTAASGRQPGRPLNLVLAIDNSGSMERADRVRILQECLRVLAGQLQPQDRVSVVAFARTARLWVDGLPGSQAGELSQRVGGLTPQGGTNLEDAMNLAYQTALRHYLANGVNRVVLLTDGAANLGDVTPESLKKKVETNRQQGIALDCFGIGWEGYNDDLLEVLSRNGDGRYGFVNTPEAATTEFAGQLAGALKVAASDVKVQVEFNPRRVATYRQIGYAKHQLKQEQFRDNTVDAAEIGAAEAGNALYVVQVNPGGEGPLATVRVRFKVPGTSDYREHEWPVPYEGAAKSLEQSRPSMRLATTASAFSEWLVSSPFATEVTPDKLLGYLSGVPETCPADPRPKKLEWMIRQAKSVAGK